MRRLIIGIAVLVLLLAGADIGIRIWTESWVGSQLEESLHLSEKPRVKIGGFPFLLHFAQGDIPRVTMTAETFTVRGVPFQEARIELDSVRFPPSRLLLGDQSTITADDGDGVVTMSAADVNRALEAQGVPATVRFENGAVHVSSAQFPGGEVEAQASIEQGVVVLRAFGASFSVKLPELVPGLTFRSLRIDGSLARLSVHVRKPKFDVNG